MRKPVVFARMPKEALFLVKHVSAARGETVSSFVRRAVLKELANLSYLDPETKKALGLTPIKAHEQEREQGRRIDEQ